MQNSNSGCGTIDDTIRNVELLIIDMEQNFKEEIQILLDIDYPQVQKHQRIHEALMNKTNALFQKKIQRDVIELIINEIVLN